ncbi:MAG: tRNA (guanosine(37)-N1)-methyltransferase TrmD [Alphaproteobacteria bacterium]
MTAPVWHATVFTLFPDMFPGPLGFSLTGRALEKKIWDLTTVNIRDFARDNYKSVDDTPFGGGAGMVIRADILDQALQSVPRDSDVPLIYLSPRGKPLNQAMVKNWIKGSKIHLICGRYEGIDERLLQKRRIQEVSLGDFVLSGGELGALALIDACVRLLPGVMGDQGSLLEESFEQGLLEYPHYTKPQVWEGLEVPSVLLSGHHEQIQKWKLRESQRLTQKRRPDLWAEYVRRKFEK